MKHLMMAAAVVALVCGCSVHKKTMAIRNGSVTAALSLPEEERNLPQFSTDVPTRDTLTVTDDEGREMLIMKAVRDENGEMVASDVIQAAMVTARFRNIAERNGKVDLRFEIRVPQEMMDSKWQLRFYPDLMMLEDSIRLEPVVITGEAYRMAQLKGYQQYEKFLASIISDESVFIDKGQLEIFLKRNLPELYRFKNDSSFVSDEEFASAYGVTEQEAVEHYTDSRRLNRNRRRAGMKEKVFHKFVRSPIERDGLKLDTVMRGSEGAFIYCYVQPITVRPRLKKAEIALSGEIMDQDRPVYRIPQSSPITFYISSLSAFVDGKERYITKIMERRVEASTACWIDFGLNSSVIDTGLGENATEIGRIKENLSSLMDNKDFEMDSIIVTASCSPEGSYEHNRKLSEQRSRTVSDYFGRWMKHHRDSTATEAGVFYDMEKDSWSAPEGGSKEIRFISKSNPENWTMLCRLIDSDSTLCRSDKEFFSRNIAITDLDMREENLRQMEGWKYMREKLYPRLRTVRFSFNMHRRGMVKDTVTTTVLDSVYMKGVQAIRDMDYKTAVSLLRPYADYNTAVAYCSMGYNASALDILTRLDSTPQVKYLLAVLYSRTGDYRSAVENYLSACRSNPSYISRGNLDPEISQLIKDYGLNKEEM